MIDVTQAPYNCRFDWTGSDATATDNYAGLQAAINDAAVLTPPGVDLGGSIGDVLQLPLGAGLVSQKLVLPFGVSMRGQGQSYYSTVLKMSDNFDPNSHFIDVGDETTHLAAMGCGVQDMILYSRNSNAAPNKSMVFTNNAQDTDPVVGRCRIYAGNRAAIWAEKGWGGATIVNFRNITCHNNGGPGSTPIIWCNYGDGTEVMFDIVQVANPAGGNVPGAYGLYCAGGRFHIKHLHAEQVWTGAIVDLAGGGKVLFEHGTGGNGVDRLITINNRPSQSGKTRVRNMAKNGANYVVLNGLSGGTSYTTDIDAEVVL